MPDLLRDLGPRLRQPDFEEILAAHRRRTRRTRLAALAAAGVALAVAVAGTLLAPGASTRTDVPPVDGTRPPTPSPTPEVVVPSGQQTIAPELGRGDVHGYDVLATVTTTQPEHQGASELTAVVPDTRQFASTFCRGASDLYYFIDLGDGSAGWDRCSPTAATTLEPDVDLGDLFVQDVVQSPQTIRMWVARPSPRWLACIHDGGSDCTISEITPLAGADVDFGFEVYAHRPTLAFELLDDAGNGEPYPIQALATVDGAGWIVDRAVVAAPDADRLVLDLPAADDDRTFDVYPGLGPHLERCRAQHDELPDPATTDSRVYAKALERACGTDLRLTVDGTVIEPVTDPHAHGHFQALGGMLSAGAAHDVVVEVVRGDPRNVTYAVVLRRPTRVP